MQRWLSFIAYFLAVDQRQKEMGKYDMAISNKNRCISGKILPNYLQFSVFLLHIYECAKESGMLNQWNDLQA